jgi:hypothetical protein
MHTGKCITRVSTPGQGQSPVVGCYCDPYVRAEEAGEGWWSILLLLSAVHCPCDYLIRLEKPCVRVRIVERFTRCTTVLFEE